MLPHLNVGQMMADEAITATEKFTQRPLRYSEASLVRKLEELGIGRPSTYAPTIHLKSYVIKGDKPALQDYLRSPLVRHHNLHSQNEIVGRENRLCPEILNVGYGLPFQPTSRTFSIMVLLR